MDTNIDTIVSAAVHQAKEQNRLLWADELANSIVESTPLPLVTNEVAEQITFEAIRQGAAVLMPPKR